MNDMFRVSMSQHAVQSEACQGWTCSFKEVCLRNCFCH